MGYVVGGGMNLGQVNIFLDKKQQQNVATCKHTVDCATTINQNSITR